MIHKAVVWVNDYTPTEISIGPSEEGEAQDTDMVKNVPTDDILGTFDNLEKDANIPPRLQSLIEKTGNNRKTVWKNVTRKSFTTKKVHSKKLNW